MLLAEAPILAPKKLNYKVRSVFVRHRVSHGRQGRNKAWLEAAGVWLAFIPNPGYEASPRVPIDGILLAVEGNLED